MASEVHKHVLLDNCKVFISSKSRSIPRNIGNHASLRVGIGVDDTVPRLQERVEDITKHIKFSGGDGACGNTINHCQVASSVDVKSE